MQKFNAETPVIPSNSKEYYQRTEAAVKIPIFQTLGTGIIIFAVFGLLGWVWGWTYTVRIAATVAGSAMGGYWYLSLRQWRTDSRPDKPFIPAAPKEAGGIRKLVHVKHDRVKENGHYQQDEYDLPGDPAALQTLARGLKGGRPFSESVWAGKNKPFSIPEFRLLRQLGIKKYGLFQYISERDPRQGIEPTDKGWELIEELADGDMEEFDE